MLDFSGMRNQNAQAKVGETQGEIAKRIGISPSRYAQLMKGTKRPTLGEIEKMCKGFGCQVLDLAEYKD